jgi:hypothetical protein
MRHIYEMLNLFLITGRLFLQEFPEPAGGILRVSLQSIVVVHEVYPKSDREGIPPLKVIEQ